MARNPMMEHFASGVADINRDGLLMVLKRRDNYIQQDKTPSAFRQPRVFTSPFDINYFNLYLASSLAVNQEIRTVLNQYYEQDKVRYYNLARTSPVFDIIDGLGETLEVEVSIRRVLGIIVASYDDKTVSDYLVNVMMKCHPELNVLTKEPFLRKKALELTGRVDSYYAESNVALLVMMCAAYIMALRTDPASKEYEEYLSPAWAMVLYRKQFLKHNEQKNFGNTDWSNGKLQYTHLRWKRETIEAIKDFSQISYIMDLVNAVNNTPDISTIQDADENNFFVDFLSPSYNRCRKEIMSSMANGAFDDLENLLKGNPENDGDIIETVDVVAIMGRVFDYLGLSVTALFCTDSEKITPDIRKTIYKLLSTIDCINASHNGAYHFNVHRYVLALIFYWLGKVIIRHKEFYFKNNSESQYYALRELEEETNRLTAQLSLVTQQNEELQKLLEKYKETIDEIVSDIKSKAQQASDEKINKTVSEYNAEISSLESTIRLRDKEIEKLQAELEREKAKSTEVDRLREIVFDLDVFDLPDEQINLGELLSGKRIIIVGGHVNWQNKMRNEYPDLVVIDGHAKNVNLSIFSNADLVLFNTANMSHSVYYKLIDAFRSDNTKYDYLGRVTNPALLEKEIAYLIQKNL